MGFPVLRRVKVEPYFKGVQRQAIWSIPRQWATQVHLVPKSAFWEEDGFAPGMHISDAPVSYVMANFGGDSPSFNISSDDWMLNEGESSEVIDLVCNQKWEWNNSTHYSSIWSARSALLPVISAIMLVNSSGSTCKDRSRPLRPWIAPAPSRA